MRLLAAGVAAIGALIGLGLFFDRRRLPDAPADAALVFGTGLDWKAEARCRKAAELWQRGLVRRLVVSGGVPMPGSQVSEAAWFKQRLVTLGVPAGAILEEPRATNTAENVAFALPILQAAGCRSVILVMSDFEGIRAHLTARRAWQGQAIAIYDYHARSGRYWHPWTWWLTRSGWQLSWYTLPRLFRYRLLPYLWARNG
jgi:uncharacterized SAM-binding protein YcdF (DUF218 family)